MSGYPITGEDMQQQRREDRWTIDKRIPVSVIAAILAQAFAFTIWAKGIDGRVEQLEKNQVSATTIAVSGERLVSLQEKVTEIKGNISDVNKDVGELKKTVGDLKEEIRRSGFNGKR